jgi:hypothetical protein
MGCPVLAQVFYGVYKVLGHNSPRTRPALTQEWSQARFFYDLERDPRFHDFRDRLIVDWGGGTRAWVQKLDNTPLLEILPAGRKLSPFVDYLEFSLTHAELRALFENEEAHRDWQIPLSAVAGIYLILDERSGNQYIGSAHGESGIWGRWRDYASSGHGGNLQLRDLIKKDSRYSDQFRFSVLQILPKTMARDEVLQRETRYKQKLGTRATGLNSN